MITKTVTAPHQQSRYVQHQSVIASGGYYGSCECGSSSSARPTYFTHGTPVLDARTPLLNTASSDRPFKCINAKIFSLGVLFVGGFTIGSYLLYNQGCPLPIRTVFNLVSRDEWGAQTLPTGQRLHSNHVSLVLLYHTSTGNCFTLTDCEKFMQQYQKIWQQKENIDIPFNFLIGGDGRTYEARGWSIQSAHSPVRSDRVLSIAFIGNFTESVPSVQQLSGALGLLSELRFQRKIARNYRISGVRCNARSHHDAKSLFALTSKWQCWDNVVALDS